MKITKLTILSLLILPLLSGCFLLPQNTNTDVTPSGVEGSQEEIDTSDWKTYRNEEYGFEIKYPNEWEYTEIREGNKVGEENITKSVSWVIFDVEGSQEGKWEVQFYRKSDELEQDISQIGNQFNDRRERRENVEFNDVNALYVRVTTEQYEWWVSESIYFSRDDVLFKIGNGAIKDDEFDYFYKSFIFIN